MKTAGLIFLWLAAVSVSAETNQAAFCCRHPIRIFGDHTTVNLTPLFQWWTRHGPSGKSGTNRAAEAEAATDRPLSAWQRITGIKAGELEYSWTVDAIIYTSPTVRTNARIILKNPPATEEQAFYALKAQITEDGVQIANAQHAYQADVKAAQRAEDRARTYSRSWGKLARIKAGSYARRATQEHEAANNALNKQKQWEAARALAEKQFSAIPAVNGNYRIDWFALAIGRTKSGVLIYDLGVVDPNSP